MTSPDPEQASPAGPADWAALASTREETTASLADEIAELGRLAKAIKDIASEDVPETSRLGADNAAAVTGQPSQAVASYITERAANASRFATAVYEAAIKSRPGQVELDGTVVNPLLRGALEDAGAIIWLLEPQDQRTRLTRVLRVLRHDGEYFASNHLLLAKAGVGRVPEGLAKALTLHMQNEMIELKDHYARVAVHLGLDPREVSKPVATSLPIKESSGPESVRMVTWKLLSDLSHYSYSLSRYFASYNEYVEMTNAVISLRVFLIEVNEALRDALTLLAASTHQPK